MKPTITPLEGNKIIAEFMGLKYEKKKYWDGNKNWYKHVWNGFELSELEYNSSWDWLMPVIEKIESLYGGDAISVRIQYHICEVEMNTQYALANDFHLPEIWERAESKIEATWLTVIAFINWYNQNKK